MLKAFQKWVQYVNQKSCPGQTILERIFELTIALAKNVITEKELDELMVRSIYCIENVPVCLKISSGKLVSDQEYLELRINDSGAPHQFYFAQLDAKLEVTDQLKEDVHFKCFIKQAGYNVSTINDLYSFKRELNLNTHKFNYVYIKMKNANVNAQDAVDMLIAEAEFYERMAHYHGHKLKKLKNKALDRFVENILAVMLGNAFWSSTCKRYNREF